MSKTSVLILDGGLGTTLEDEYHVKFSDNTPLWSSHLLIDQHQGKEVLLGCQTSFGQVPVDVLLTATYQVSAEGFARTITDDHPEGFNRSEITPFLERALAIAEAAKAPSAGIALSVGPYGACMIPSQEYSGRYDSDHDSVAQLYAWHKDRFQLFAAIDRLPTRIGYIAFETVPRLDEVLAIRRLLAHNLLAAKDTIAVALAAPAWISCVFPGEASTLPDGSPIHQVVDALLSTVHSNVVPWGVGINCTRVGKVGDLVQRYEEAVLQLISTGRLKEWPSLVLYPDGTTTEVYDTTTKTWRVPQGQLAGTDPWETQLAQVVTEAKSRKRWRSIVAGGCCKASHADIRNLRAKLLRSD
jgi:homocysteine S-methyltransferase